MSKTLTFGWNEREISVGDYLKKRLGSRKTDDGRYSTVYEPVKVVGLNKASFKMENGDTVMAKTGNMQGS